MNILQVIPRFNPRHGGGVNVVYNLSKFLTLRGHKITILTTDWEYDDELIKPLKKLGVLVFPFHAITNVCLFIPSPDMKSWLSTNLSNYDIIHLNGARSYQNNLIFQYSQKLKIPYILQAHGSIVPIVERIRLKKIYDIIWGTKIFKNLSGAIALVESEAAAYEKMGVDKNKIEIIPNGVDLSNFTTLPDKGQFRRRYKIPENTKIVLYVGRLHQSKGLDLLIDAFYKVQIIEPNSKLILIGPGDGFEQILIKKIKDSHLENKIIVTGLLKESEKISAFVDSDVFVTPKFYGFPITFLEAWACGLPVITTNIGDNLNWMNNQCGLIAEYSGESLCNKILQIFHDTALRKRLGDNAKTLVRTELNWEVIAEKVEKLYLNVISY